MIGVSKKRLQVKITYVHQGFLWYIIDGKGGMQFAEILPNYVEYFIDGVCRFGHGSG